MITWLSRLRVAFSVLGLGTMVMALSRDDRNLMWVAIGCLGASLVVRLLLKRELGKLRQADDNLT